MQPVALAAAAAATTLRRAQRRGKLLAAPMRRNCADARDCHRFARRRPARSPPKVAALPKAARCPASGERRPPSACWLAHGRAGRFHARFYTVAGDFVCERRRALRAHDDNDGAAAAQLPR